MLWKKMSLVTNEIGHTERYGTEAKKEYDEDERWRTAPL